jgi:hypothetical protein
MSNLFTAVSVEQQAIVTGGLFGQSNSGSIYQELELAIGSGSKSTTNGSEANNLFVVRQKNTGSYGSVGYNALATAVPVFPSLNFN